MDPNIAKIISSRVRKNPPLVAAAESAAQSTPSHRSPLKPRNFEAAVTRSSPVKSPRKDVADSPSDTIKRLLKRESLESNVKELLSRESPSKNINTRTYTSTTTSPTRKTVTKTVITEKEEKYERKETISYSGNKEFMKEVESGKIDEMLSSARKERNVPIETGVEELPSSVKYYSPKKLLEAGSTRTPARKAAGPGHTPGPLDQTPVSEAPDSDDFFSARKAKWAKLKEVYHEMDDDSFHLPASNTSSGPGTPNLGRTSPLKNSPLKKTNLAQSDTRSPIRTNPYNRFTSPDKKMDSSSNLASPSRVANASPTRSVSNITAKPFQASPTRPRGISPVKAPTGTSPSKATTDINRIKPSPDDSLVTSLKAQGFTETDSQSKLCYDFKETRRTSVSPSKGYVNSAAGVRERSVSPVKGLYSAGGIRERSVSPVKGLYSAGGLRERSVSPVKSKTQETRGRAPARSTVLSSPTKSAIEPRSVSPHKPHPLQFVSPQVQAASAPPPPPKPTRTYEFDSGNEQHAAQNESPSCRSVAQKKNMFDIPEQPAAEGVKSAAKAWQQKPSAASKALADNRCDTPQRRSVAQKKNMFESQSSTPEMDPAMMSMSDRRKMFEKNNSIPTPIARFGESVTPAMIANAKPTQAPSTEAWKRKRSPSPVKSHIKPAAKKSSPDSYIKSAAKPRVHEAAAAAPNVAAAAPLATAQVPPSPATPRVGNRAAEMHKKLFEKPDWRDNEIARQVDEQKQKDMELLMSRYNHTKSSDLDEGVPAVPVQQNKQGVESRKNKESPEKYYPGVNSMKKVKVSPPKSGGLYPEVYESSTISSTDSRPDSVQEDRGSRAGDYTVDTLNSSYESTVTVNSDAPSLGMEIVALAGSRKTAGGEPYLDPIPEDNDSMETEDMSESVCEEIDDMLDEALDDSQDENDGSVLMSPPTKPQGSTSSAGSSDLRRCESSSSWEFHTPQPNKTRDVESSRFKTPLVLMDKSPNRAGNKEEAPVTHTVSFYRKQRPVHVTPVQRIILNPVLEQSMVENAASPRATISQKIKILQSEGESQMSIITQASNALSLCRSTKEFYGSAEQVEGERLLLEATHKHNAALKEISRLKTEGGLGVDPDTDTSVRGTVCINSISLKLKKEFIEQLRSGERDDQVHYFLCLVKCAGQVIPTQMLSTLHGLDSKTLDFPNLIRLSDLPKNFSIQLEVYGLQTMRESLDHETKYHLKKEKSSFFGLTPKLLMGKQESRLTRPDVGSPKGPLAVRTSSFKVVGNTTITIDNLKRKEWRLDNVPHVSPLEGNIAFQLNCYSESQVKFRGFLTMFDDVSGYGAWHRRWFVLEGNRLSYWKYPENQKKQEPIGSIDLGACITENVHIAPREICSRMNTFLLESRRPAKSSDRESLVLVRQGGHTIIRHLLSADSREERIEWCQILNKALDNLRAWDPKEETRSETASSTGSDSTETSSVSTDIW